MSPEHAIVERLLDSSAVTALVASRVTQLVNQQKTVLPAVRVQALNGEVRYHLRGPHGVAETGIQVDALATDGQYVAVAALADAIDGALSGAQFDTLTSPAQRVSGIFRIFYAADFVPDEFRRIRIVQRYRVFMN